GTAYTRGTPGDADNANGSGVTLLGASLTATDPSGTATASINLTADQAVQITNSTVTADAGVTVNSTNSTVTITNSTLQGTGVDAGDLSVTAAGAVLIQTASTLAANDGGVTVQSNGSSVTINGSTLTAVDGSGTFAFISLSADQAVAITNSTLTADSAIV